MGNIFSSIVDEWRTEDKLMLLECWARDGFTLTEIAEKVGVSPSTLKKWRTEYEDIGNAISKGKEIVDYRVENALLKSALGYRTVETKTIINSMPDKDGNRTVRVEKIEREIAPNVTACMAWLNNRKPNQWKRNRDNVMELNDDKSNITVNIIRHGRDDDESWNISTSTGKNTESENAEHKTEKVKTESKESKVSKSERKAVKKTDAKAADKATAQYSDEELEWLEN